MERFPKKKEEEIDADSADELSESKLDRIAQEAERMSPAEQTAFAKAELVESRERIAFQKERVAHLKAQVERLQEQLRSVEGAEKAFIQEQLDEKKEQIEEYLSMLQEEDVNVVETGDIVDQLEESNKKHLN